VEQATRQTARFRVIGAVAASIFLSLSVFLLAVWSKNWNHPDLKDLEIYKGPLKRTPMPLLATITCKCPTAFLTSGTANVSVSFSLVEEPNLPPGRPREPVAGPAVSVADHDVWVRLEASAADVHVPGSPSAQQDSAYLGQLSEVPSGIKQDVPVTIRPKDTGPVKITFHLLTSPGGGEAYDGDFGSISWSADSRPAFIIAALPFIYSLVALICTLTILLFVQRRFGDITARAEAQMAEASERARNNPEESHYAWEIARIKLEAYFDRNLIQVNLVFWVAVAVVTVGFAFVLAGIVLCFRDPSHIGTPLVAAISGVITQFIGATFMVIYRSTMKQANDFMAVLERINIVNMAAQVLNGIPDASAELKNEVRARMVGLLLDRGAMPAPIASTKD
jgi:hypothetical protein